MASDRVGMKLDHGWLCALAIGVVPFPPFAAGEMAARVRRERFKSVAQRRK